MQDSLSVTFAALSDPTRRAMLAQLRNGEASVTDLAKPFGMSLPAITKHIKVLEKAGLITKSKDAQWRPCKLKEDGMKEAADWIEEYRVYWEESFDRLEAYLKTVTTEKKNVPAKPGKEGKKNARKK